MSSVYKSGFTLLELLVVISIIGVLASVVLVSFPGAQKKARLAQGLQFSDSLRASLQADMVAWWTFDETAGAVAKDNYFNQLHGTVYGATWVKGIVNNGLSFDGNDYAGMVFPNNEAGQGKGAYIPTGDMIFEMWFKTSNPSGGLQVVYGTNFNGGCDRVIWLSNGILNFNVWAEVNFAGTKKVNDDSWHHLAYVFDKSWGFKVYVDSKPYASSQVSTNCGVGCSGFNWADTLYIGTGRGCRGGADGGYFVGSIDEVRLYSAPLPLSVIQQHYADGLKTHQPLAYEPD